MTAAKRKGPPAGGQVGPGEDAIVNYPTAQGFGAIRHLTHAHPAESGSQGRMVDAHRLVESFTEGNGFVYGQPKVLQDRGSGSGVTWNCATDTDIANRQRDCDIKWGGGLDTAETVTDSVLVTK